mmetsp:Transcript_13041/g.40174  ORF Transcript_13041/g.40174 Transcript_13041/m.40174 type:complete len:125 (+) Transcript_13041:104-478(+)
MRAFLAHLACGLVGILYPLQQSHRAVKAMNHDQTMSWLLYWVIVGMLMIPEFYLDRIFYYTSLYFVYNIAKLGGLLWLVHPKTRGYNLLFIRYLEPYFMFLWTEGEQYPLGRWLIERAKNLLSV